ncbi:MAG TPA: AraC family transcriptional regulator [Chloroflexota bacterium]|jgi:AraC-like DNA-binding protein|nr:AraC family transcriptional regulator [Chloroflexota bacterium]
MTIPWRPFVFRTGAASPLGRIRAAGLVGPGDDPPAAMRTLRRYALVYLLDGRGRYLDAQGTAADLKAGDLLLLFPGLAHRYGPDEARQWKEFFLIFDGPVFELWEACGLLRRRQPIHHLEPVAHWLPRLQGLLRPEDQAGAPGAPGSALIDLCRLQLLLAEILLQGRRPAPGAAEPSWVTRACALLEGEPGRQLPLPQVAQRLGLPYETFRKRFKQLVGTSPARYRADRLIERACRLIEEGRLTNRQIAEQLGFCDEFYFSRRFKQLVGYSPGRFRRGPRPPRV